MIKFKKKYQLWVNYGSEGWNFYEYDTIEECLLAPSYGMASAITQKVDWEIKEK